MWGLVTNAVGAAKAATTVVGNATYAAAAYLYPTTPINGDVTPHSRPNTPPVDGLFSAQVSTEEFSEDQKRVQEALTFLKTAHYSKFQKTRFQGIIDDLNIILNNICQLQEQEKSEFKKIGQLICLSELHINLQIQELHRKYEFKVLGDTEEQLRTYLTKFSRNQSLESKTTAPIIDAPKKELLDKVTEKFAFAFSHYFSKKISRICDNSFFFEKEYYKINIFIQLIKEDPGLQSGENIIGKIVDSFADFPSAGKSALREAFQFLRSFILMSIGSEEVDKLEDEIDSIRTLVVCKVKTNSINISDDDNIIAKDSSNKSASKKRYKKPKPKFPNIEDPKGWKAPGIRQEDFENSEQALAFIQRVCASNQECDDKNLVKFACAIQNNLFIPNNNDAITIFLQLIREGKIKDSHVIYRFVLAITSTETKGDIFYFHQVFAELIYNKKVTIPIVHEVFSNAISDNRVSDQNAICFFAKSILLGIVLRESAKNFIGYFLEQYRSGKNIISIDTSPGAHLSNLFLQYANGDKTVCDEFDFFPLPASGRTSRANSIVSMQSATPSSSRSVTPVPEVVEAEPVEEAEIERREETDADKAWRLGTQLEKTDLAEFKNGKEYEDFCIKIENKTITDWSVINTFAKAFFDKGDIFKTNPSLTFRFLSFLIKKIDAEEEWDETQKSVLKKKAADTLKNCLIEFSSNIDSATHFDALEKFVMLLNEITFPIRQAYLSFIEKIRSGDISGVNIVTQFSEVFLSERTTNPIAFDRVAIAKLMSSVEEIRLKNTITSMPQNTIRKYIQLEERLKNNKSKIDLLSAHDKNISLESLNVLQRINEERNERARDQLKKKLQDAMKTELEKAETRLSIESAEDLRIQLDVDYQVFTAALNPPPAPKKSRWQRTKEFFSNLLPSFRRARA